MSLDVEHLFAAEYPRMVGWFARKLYCSDLALCQDLAGEVFARAWAKRDTYAERPGATATSWLYRIASNLLIDHCRREGLARWGSLDALAEVGREPSYTLRFDELEQRAEIRAAVDALLPTQRAAIVGRFYEGRRVKDLAQIGTEHAVKKLQQRALANLRRQLKGVAA